MPSDEMIGGAVQPDQTLDARGLLCPMPVLKARKALKALSPGQVLAVQADDPAAHKDFPAFSEATGHALVAVLPGATGAEATFLLRRA